MKRFSYLMLLISISTITLAQPAVVGTLPANNTTNVAAQTTLKVWFGAPIDTTKEFSGFRGYLTSIDTIISQTYSANRDTMYMNVRLAPSRAYFLAIYWLPGQGELAIPYNLEFTTGSSFAGTTVSGTVTSSSPGTITPAYALVGMSDIPVQESQPHFVAGAVADADGNFIVHNVPNGTLYPITAKERVTDGNIDPSTGDAVGFGNAVVVAGSPITGVALVLSAGFPLSYATALDSALGFQSAHLTGSKLRRVQAYRADADGTSLSNWEFFFFTPGVNTVTQVSVQSFLTGTKSVDYGNGQAIPFLRNIDNPAGAASSAVFVGNCESQGGLAFRQQSVPANWNFYRTLQLGQVWYTNIPYLYQTDTTNFYWMAQYHFDIDYSQDSSVTQRAMWFIGDYATGAVLSTMGVDPTAAGLPGTYALEQNYPNPFNPTTVVSWQLPVAGSVKLAVYDLIGREVAVLVNERKSAGRYDATFDAAGMPSGVYFYRLTTDHYVATKKMVLLK